MTMLCIYPLVGLIFRLILARLIYILSFQLFIYRDSTRTNKMKINDIEATVENLFEKSKQAKAQQFALVEKSPLASVKQWSPSKSSLNHPDHTHSH